MQSDIKTWETVIGLEIHAQINSRAKLFSNSSTLFGSEQNCQVSIIDAAMPGMLPVLNEKCVEQAVKTGLGINATINKLSMFDRKNYFYADLPQGYQISQFYYPIVSNGFLMIDINEGKKRIDIERIHIEQDAGKSIHDQSPTESFIDLNRSGIGLMEIVTKPDMRNAEEAAEFVKKLRSILRYLETCDGDMEKGSLRCDANVSVRKVGSEILGTRVEIKNINSIRNIIKAIKYEADRQIELIENGGTVVQETRLFDADQGITNSMRSKEDAADYRYFHDPDLLPLVLNDDYIERIKESLPEMPEQKFLRYIKEYNLSEYDAGVLVVDKNVAEFFEKAASLADSKMVANWITAELFARLNKSDSDIESSPISPEKLAKLINLINDNVISGKIAKKVFEIMFNTGENPDDIVKKEGLKQVTDVTAIETAVAQVITDNMAKVQEYRNGKEKLFGFFVGKVMQITQGKANPSLVNDLLKEKLNS